MYYLRTKTTHLKPQPENRVTGYAFKAEKNKVYTELSEKMREGEATFRPTHTVIYLIEGNGAMHLLGNCLPITKEEYNILKSKEQRRK